MSPMSETGALTIAAPPAAGPGVSADPIVVDLTDIQAGIFDPTEYAFETHMFVSFGSSAAARSFVAAVGAQVTTADRYNGAVPHPDLRVSTGVTYTGLAALGVAADVLASFPEEFRSGMAGRAQGLGDNGRNAPARWETPFNQSQLHMWVMVQSNAPALLSGRVTELGALAAQSGVAVLSVQSGAMFGPGQAPAKEHFGFNDNLGQPGVAGVGQPIQPGQGTFQPGNAEQPWKPIPVGCFLLGYENGFGETPAHPSADALRKNSTYMVFRKLEQDVPAFHAYVAETAKLLSIDEELCAAKFVGRWRSGTPLESSPDHDDPTIAADGTKRDDFTYEADGMHAPHFCHIRRANPRNSLGARTVVDMTNHRIIRRSVPYGPFLAAGAPDNGASRGLFFRAFNASILDQFEMIQSAWINNANEMHGLSTDRDPFVGTVEPMGPVERQLGSSFTIPQPDGSCPTRYNLPSFVTVKGGEYFFYPSCTALRWLAAGPVVAS